MATNKPPNDAQARARLLEAGVHAFCTLAPGYLPRDEAELEEAVNEIAGRDQAAANMIQLALRQVSVSEFLAAVARQAN